MSTAKRSKVKKMLLIGLLVVVVVLVGLGISVGNYFTTWALTQDSTSGTRHVLVKPHRTTAQEEAHLALEKRIADTHKERVSEFERLAGKPESVSIESFDHLKLQGFFWRAKKPSKKSVLIVHGYKGHVKFMETFALYYLKRGYNVLIPWQRAHGTSQGKYITLGVFESKDDEDWVQWLRKQVPGTKVVVHGVSMGGAITLIMAGDHTPGVNCYVEDCTYTSFWDIFGHELKARFGLPVFPTLYLTELVSRVRAGIDFHERSPLDAVKEATAPILFVHGTSDDFIPPQMGRTLYKTAITKHKELLLIKGADHAQSFDTNPARYEKTLDEFLGKYL